VTTERAFQQLDPLGALIGRPLTFLAAAGIPIYAAAQTLACWDEIDYPILAALSIVLIIAACVILDFATNPLRAPFTRRTQLIISGTAILAFIASSASMWNSNSYIRDDWGPFAIGLVLLAMTQYRPAFEIAEMGLFSALLAGVLALLQAQSFVTPIPPICFALIAVTPILTLSLASAAFAHHLVAGLERWKSRARKAVTAFRDEHSDWIARSVQQDRVTILNQEVVPFFSDVLRRGTIRETDRERARDISDAIRAVMIAEVDRTWLDAVVEHATGVGLDEPTVGHPAVVDPGRFAMQMNADQRTVVRAMVVALCGNPACDPRDLLIELSRKGSRCSVVLHAGLTTTNHMVRDELAPYFAVMKILFSNLTVRFSEYTLELRFSYEQ
jgi:NADH:ubiquinone oxidoreductase subunit 6 (subunit J)